MKFGIDKEQLFKLLIHYQINDGSPIDWKWYLTLKDYNHEI